ncbi:MAG: hypothetical protein AAGM22_10515 [Acidobacteriota bacterium]
MSDHSQIPDPSHQDVRYRHARDTSLAAPKPGHHLGTASFRLGDQSVVQWLVEGPENNAISYTALVTDFELTRYLRYRVAGSAVEALNDLPFSPFTPRLDLDIELEGVGDFSVTGVRIVFSKMRAPNGVDPDLAIARFSRPGAPDLRIVISELRRGWEPILTVLSSVLGLGHCLDDSPRDLPDGRIRVTDPASCVQVQGHFAVTRGICSSLAI